MYQSSSFSLESFFNFLIRHYLWESIEVSFSIGLVPNNVLNCFFKVVNSAVINFDLADFFEMNHVGQDLFGFWVMGQAFYHFSYVQACVLDLVLFIVIFKDAFLLFLGLVSTHLNLDGRPELCHAFNASQENVFFFEIFCKQFFAEPVLYYWNFLVFFLCEQSWVIEILLCYLLIQSFNKSADLFEHAAVFSFFIFGVNWRNIVAATCTE
jgi:hypothetical protein